MSFCQGQAEQQLAGQITMDKGSEMEFTLNNHAARSMFSGLTNESLGFSRISVIKKG
jgi:hypothetical protein